MITLYLHDKTHNHTSVGGKPLKKFTNVYPNGWDPKYSQIVLLTSKIYPISKNHISTYHKITIQINISFI